MKGLPELVLGAAFPRRDHPEVQGQRAVDQVAAAHELVDPVEDYGPLGGDDGALVVGVVAAGSMAPARNKPAQCIG